MASDRGDMMGAMRRRVLAAEPGLGREGREALLAATTRFERAVWLVGRYAAALGEAEGVRPEPGRPAAAVAPAAPREAAPA